MSDTVAGGEGLVETVAEAVAEVAVEAAGWLPWVILAAGLLAVASTLALWSYGRFARRARGAPSEAIPAGLGGALDAQIPDGPDAAALMVDGAEALALRLDSLDSAVRSVDVMTYIWSEDRSGRTLALALAEAAGRGVRVRLLVDDVAILGRDPLWLALDRTPGIEVRLFNPVRARASAFRRGMQMMLLALRYNRRMHSKMWLVDGRLAVIGGRNLGDEYFDLAEPPVRNFADAEVLLTGPVVARAAGVFDSYWNSDVALPISALWSGRLPRLPRLRRRKGKARRPLVSADLAAAERIERALDGVLERRRQGALQLVADPPEKALGRRGERGWLPDLLAPVFAAAQSEVRLVTPYLVPGADGMAQLLGLRERGVEVRLLTNALAVADHAIVHGAYRWYRGRLLAAGVSIHEYLAPRDSGHARMLHAKLLLVDGSKGFVGSFNFDQRSAWLNTELGVLFETPELVAELAAWIDAQTAPELAYAVGRRGRFVAWTRGEDRPRWIEPQTHVGRRVLAFAVGHLPIHRLL